MTKTAFALTALVAVFFMGAQTASAQDMPLEFEGRLGAAIPVGDASDELSTGLSFGASIGYRIIPALTVFGGYTQNNFGVDEPGISANTGGFDLGARYNLPMMMSPWIRGGLVFHRWEISGNGSPETSDYSLGFEVGGGIAWPIGDMISITPGIRYTTFTDRFEGETADVSTDALVIDLGVRVGL